MVLGQPLSAEGTAQMHDKGNRVEIQGIFGEKKNEIIL